MQDRSKLRCLPYYFTLLLASVNTSAATANPVTSPAARNDVNRERRAARPVTTDVLERMLDENRRAADERSSQQLGQVLGWLGIGLNAVAALFGALITVCVVFFAIRTKSEAVAEAKLAAGEAKELISKASNEFQLAAKQNKEASDLLKAIRAESAAIHETAEGARSQVVASTKLNETFRLDVTRLLNEIKSERDKLIAIIANAERDTAKIASRSGRASEGITLIAQRVASGGTLSDDELEFLRNVIIDTENIDTNVLTADQLKANIAAQMQTTHWWKAQVFADEILKRFPAEPSAYADGLYYKAIILSKQRHHDEAIKLHDQLIATFCGDPALHDRVERARFHRARDYYSNRNYVEAIKGWGWLADSFERDDYNSADDVMAATYLNLGVCHAMTSRLEEALQYYHIVIDRFGKCDDELAQLSTNDAYMNIACAHARNHDIDLTILALDTWYGRANPPNVEVIKQDTAFRLVREHPRFRAWVEDRST